MKSMNVKRIGAIATGAAMMGAAFVGAAVSVDTAGVGTFPFFSAGEPQVKVVIGGKAQPVDVVVGANIAAVLCNLAYKTQTVQVLNTDKLGSSGSGGELSDKEVGLTVTTPGVNPAFAYVKYDETAKAVQAQYAKTGYEVVFSDPIPLCLDTSKNASAGACTTDSDMLKKGNVEITFLGDTWTIFDYTNPTFGSITSVTLGKQITRKESFNIDESVTTQDGFTITLKDLSAFSPQRAQFDVSDKDGVLIKRVSLGESDSATIAEANNIVVKVNKVFPGAFAKQGIADVSLYSSQLVLTNGAEVSGGDSHKNWYSNIISAVVGSTDAISKIQLYNNLDQTYKTPISQTLNPGESIEAIKGMPGYKLNFLGLETVDYDTLTFSILKSYAMTLDDGAAISSNVLSIVSGKSNAFQFGSRSVNDAYILLEQATGNTTHPAGEVFYITAAGAYSNASTTAGQLTYYYSSEENAVLSVNTSYNHSGGITNVLVAIPELTETNNGSSAAIATNFHLNLLYDVTLDQFVNTIGSTTVDKIGYDNSNPAGYNGTTVANIASK